MRRTDPIDELIVKLGRQGDGIRWASAYITDPHIHATGEHEDLYVTFRSWIVDVCSWWKDQPVVHWDWSGNGAAECSTSAAGEVSTNQDEVTCRRCMRYVKGEM